MNRASKSLIFARFLDRAIDHHPVLAAFTYMFAAGCMVGFIVTTW